MDREVIDRNVLQKEIVESCITSLTQVGRAAVIASVGIGKSKMTLDILAHFNPDEIIWLTSNEVLRDVDTPLEFMKWGYEYLLDKTEIMCVQTAYKIKGRHFKFLVLDEGDAVLTDKYIEAVSNNTFDYILVVTGTITQEKKDVLDSLSIPIVYEISNQEAQDLNILNKIKFVFVEYMLSTEKTYVKKTKYKEWKTSENEEMQYIEGQYMKVLLPFLAVKKTIDDYYSKGIPFPEGENYTSLKAKKDTLKRSLDWVNSQRYRFLQSLDSSVDLSKRIILKHLKTDGDKVIVFGGLTEQVERVCLHTYHSKNKKGNTSIEDFNSGKIRLMGVCSALDRGKNMSGLNIGIFKDFDSSSTKAGQRLGRFARLAVDQEATVYFLVPYYMKRVWNKEKSVYEMRRTPTRASAWLESALVNYRVDEYNSTTIRV